METNDELPFSENREFYLLILSKTILLVDLTDAVATE
jgi:hypothetical protein